MHHSEPNIHKEPADQPERLSDLNAPRLVNPSAPFSDIVHDQIIFDRRDPAEALVLDLIDASEWLQRLRSIRQLGNTHRIYKDAEHSRFGHAVGVAYLAAKSMESISSRQPELLDEIEYHRPAVLAAALLHDNGHLGPGSHLAFRMWYPDEPDAHEELSARVILEDPVLSRLLEAHRSGLTQEVVDIIQERSEPRWTWQLISGNGWNVDRGDWTYRDSVHCGVEYGKYDVGALLDGLVLLSNGSIAIHEKRIDALEDYIQGRASLYKNIYFHRTVLAADEMHISLGKRARELFANGKLSPENSTLREVLEADHANNLTLATIYRMRDSWWNEQLLDLSSSNDFVMQTLADGLVRRKLLKTIQTSSEDEARDRYQQARAEAPKFGYQDVDYFVHLVNRPDKRAKDVQNALPVATFDGRVIPLADAFLGQQSNGKRFGDSRAIHLVVLPGEVRDTLLPPS